MPSHPDPGTLPLRLSAIPRDPQFHNPITPGTPLRTSEPCCFHSLRLKIPNDVTCMLTYAGTLYLYHVLDELWAVMLGHWAEDEKVVATQSTMLKRSEPG